MTHAVSLLLCLAGFAALAAATDRVQADLLGREITPRSVQCLRAGGWTLLLTALAWAIVRHGGGIGLVSYSGHTSLAAGLVYLTLIAGRRVRSARGRRWVPTAGTCSST